MTSVLMRLLAMLQTVRSRAVPTGRARILTRLNLQKRQVKTLPRLRLQDHVGHFDVNGVFSKGQVVYLPPPVRPGAAALRQTWVLPDIEQVKQAGADDQC